MPSAFEKRLKIYKEHPILLSSHNYYDLTKQIGEAIGVKITESGLEAKFKYYAGLGNAEADWAWVLAQKGIASFSIGFIGHQSDPIIEKDENGIERYLGRKFTDVELMEISQVLVPSNRGALQLSASRATEELELCELVSKSFEGDVFVKQAEKKEETKVEKVEDKSAYWVCPQCGNGFTKGVDEKELVCLCGTKCDLKENEVKHYSEEVLGAGDDKSPIPPLTSKDVGEILSKTIQTIFKGEKI
jgi:hypothetical protein